MNKANNSFQEIWDELKKCRRIAMSLHARPDGDSLGACTAMKYVLERELKCSVKLVSYDSLAEGLSNFDFSKEVEFGKDISEIDLKNFDAVIFLDCGEAYLISGKMGKDFKKEGFIINIDHHDTNSFYGNLNYVDEKSPAACSTLIDLFKEIGIKFDRELSRRLLLGVSTDTGFLQYDSNPEKGLKDSVFLIEHGADYLKDALQPLLYNQPLKLKKYFGLLFNNLKWDKGRKCGYASIGCEEIKKLGLNESEVRGGINELQFIKEFDFVFTLTELENGIKGSFRSKKGVDVSLFAKELGGGGHKVAAAFFFQKMPLAEAEKKVLAVIDKIGVHRIG